MDKIEGYELVGWITVSIDGINIRVYTCKMCGSLVAKPDIDIHNGWHWPTLPHNFDK